MKLRTKVTPSYVLTLLLYGDWTSALLSPDQPFGLQTLLVPLASWLLSLLLASSSLFFLSCSMPALLLWPGSVWMLPDGSGCALSLSHINNKPFSSAIPGSSHAIVFSFKIIKDSCGEIEDRKRDFV